MNGEGQPTMNLGSLSQLVLLTLVVGCQANIKDVPLSLVLLKDAAQPSVGAMCLDGSPTGYYIRKGEGDGAKKWILFLKGGGWCSDMDECYKRSKTSLGSSKEWQETVSSGGILSSDKTVNPDFYNWNFAYLMYCDGSCYTSDLTKPVTYNGAQLYFRGNRNLLAQVKDLKDGHGLGNATEVILTGCSAGGIAVYFHADAVRSQFSTSVKFRAFPDAGFFIDIKSYQTGKFTFREKIIYATSISNGTGGVNQDCIKAMSKNDTWKCFFAPYSYQYIKTPIFVINSLYDTYQLKNNYELPYCQPPHCSQEELRAVEAFRKEMIAQANPVINSPQTNAYFFDSCLAHCHIDNDAWGSTSIGGYTIQKAFSKWYFGSSGNSSSVRLLDCGHVSCNPTCSHRKVVQDETV